MRKIIIGLLVAGIVLGRITKIETDVKLIQKDITVIKNNHLKHIEDDVKKMDMRLWAVLIILVASVFIPFVKNIW